MFTPCSSLLSQGYRPCAQRSSILFFVMNDMGRIDPMYQFSLDAYIELFSNSIDKSLKHPRLEERIHYLNEYHTYAVYQYTCRYTCVQAYHSRVSSGKRCLGGKASIRFGYMYVPVYKYIHIQV